MHDLASAALDAALDAGAAYADVRAGEQASESITVEARGDRAPGGARGAEVEAVERATSCGVGIRVLVDGAWGFAASATEEPEVAVQAALRAVAIARASAGARRTPVRLAPVEPTVATWVTPHDRDPLEVGLDEKLALLIAGADAAGAVAGIAYATASADAWRTRMTILTSDGTAIEQTIVQVAGGVECTALDDGEVQRRSFPNSFRGHCASGGWEDVAGLDLPGQAPGIAEEAVALLTTPDLPAGRTTLVLDGNQVALQVHESVGHPLELDRILGWEAAYAGTSWVGVADLGRLRYGSPLVNLTVDSTTPGAVGTFGYDDEGTPAQRAPLVREGMLVGVLTSRETAPVLGPEARSNGTVRADGWGSLPLIRMPNIHLEPGAGTLEDLLADVDEGVYMLTNRSWSIDERRLDFAFGCEVAWEIKRGALGRRYRNPTYGGRTPVFWGSCDAIGGPEGWRVYGTPNCGKGQPAQVARVAHGAAAARFRDVTVGSG